MTTTRETEVVITETEVKKTSLHPRAHFRLAREALCLAAFADSPHLPDSYGFDAETHTLTLQRVQGRSFKDVFAVDEEWGAVGMPWAEASSYLEQYIAAETDLLKRGLMYRDLNLDHLIFTDEKAMLIDHEETVGNMPDESTWYYRSIRGTWETMAPEEFRGYGYLTERTATYRSAVLAHLALSGELPFPRFPLRSDVHHWRKRRVAQVSQDLPRSTRKAFRIALDTQPERRHADPAAFFNAFKATYEDTV